MIRSARVACRAVPLILIAAMLTLGLVAPSQAAPRVLSASTPTKAKAAGTDMVREPARGVSATAEADQVLSGRVYNEAGRQLQNILVEAVPAQDPTAEPVASAFTYDGYELDVPPGDYVIRFSSQDYEERHVYQTVYYGGGAGETITVVEGDAPRTLDDVVMTEDQGAPVTGQVLDPDGNPMANVDVSLFRFYSSDEWDYGSVDWAVTDSTGHYTFEHAKSGRQYSVLAYGGYDDNGDVLGYTDTWLGNAPGRRQAEKFTGGTAQTLSTIALQRGVDITGTVGYADSSDVSDSEIDASLVAVYPDGGFDYVDYSYVDGEDGNHFRFDHAFKGVTYTVQFYSWELQEVTYLGGGHSLDSAETFTVPADGPDTKDLGNTVIGADTSRVVGHVVDTEGDGVSYGDYIVWRRVDGQWEEYRWDNTDADGNFHTRLPWGSDYTIEVDPWSDSPTFLGGASTIDDATVFTTDADHATLTLADIVVPLLPGKVVGNVTDSDGNPVAKAWVTLYEDDCGDPEPCWSDRDETRTNDQGHYVFHDVRTDDGTRYTVGASKYNAGLQDTYLGGAADLEGAQTFTTTAGETSHADLTMANAQGVVRGTLSTEDGGDADSKTLTLYRWVDDGTGGGYFDWTDSIYLERGEWDYAFSNVQPGIYTIRASAYDYGQDTSPYLDTWLSGSSQPAGPDAPGTFTVDDPNVPVSGVDLTLLKGALLTGTVTGADGSPLSDASIAVYQWGPQDGTTDRAYVADAYTDQDGHYSTVVPKNSELFIQAFRTGYDDYSLGGSDFGSPKTEDNTLHVGAESRAFDITMAPFWGNDYIGHVGDHAGTQDEDCLAHPAYSWGDDPISYAGHQFVVDNGSIRLAGQDDGRDPFADDSRDPAIVPLQDYQDPTYGVLHGGPNDGSLCVQWVGYDAIHQVLLAPAQGGGFDATLNYDHVSGGYANGQRAGFTDGSGPGDGTTVFPGWDTTGYSDQYFNYDTWMEEDNPNGLVHNSLGSDVPGRYLFHFDGFDRGAAPVNATAPTITGTTRLAGDVLVIDPGTWTVGGEQADDLEYRYTWHGIRGEDPGNSPTYTITDADQGRRVWAEVRAWKPGHDYQTVSTAVLRLPAGPPALTLVDPPVIDPNPVINTTVGFTPPTWQEDPLPDGVTFRYQWFRNGHRIWGATGETYDTTVGDANKQLTVKVVASSPGHTSVQTVSAPATVGDLPSVDVSTLPTLSGEPKVGQTLTLDPGQWDAQGDPVSLSIRWSADFLSRDADTGSSDLQYTPVRSDAGRLLTARVTATAPGHKPTSRAVTVGPIADADVELSTLTITVVDQDDSSPIAGAAVSACETSTWTCIPSSETDAQGTWSAPAYAGSDYYLFVYPPDGSTYHSASQEITTNASGPTDHTVELFKPAPPPPNVTIPTSNGSYDGVPTVYWQEDQTFTVSGCAATPNPTYTVVFADGHPTQTGPLTAGAADSNGIAVFTATIPAFYPAHGDTTITFNVPADCQPNTPPTRINIYIDPSGVVTDQYGRPIQGATVTLLRADNAGGPFTAPASGSADLDPATPTNPETTDSIGFFQWFVSDGWYKVTVTKSGCDPVTAANAPAMQVPPLRLDLMIKMSGCAAPAVTPVISGTPKVGSTLTTATTIWPTELSSVQVQWLRDGTPITGATDTSYQLVPADRTHTISVQQTAQRPDYTQENGNGAPVSFAPATATSAGQAVGAGDAPTATAKPGITGTPKVDSQLTATPPTWSVSGVTDSRQWQRDGQAITGETGATYTVRPADVGAAITVAYTGVKDGFADGTTTSDPVTGALADAPTAAAPTLTGTPKVDSQLTAPDPTWSTSGVATAYQWRRDGSAIDGATASTYTVRPADVGHAITVRYTGTKSGYADGTVDTDPVNAVLADAPTANTGASINGSGKVDSQLAAMPPAWNKQGVANALQWFRGDTAIDGATGNVYTVQPADVGQAITAHYTGTKAGYADGHSVSNAVTAVTADAPTAAAPAILGVAKVGQIVSVAAPEWSVPDVTSSFQWLRDGQPITGATDMTYTVTAADATRVLSVALTGTRPGYANGSVTSTTVTVAKNTSKTTAKLAKAKLPIGKAASITVTVTVPGVAAPTGSVQVLEGKKVLATGKVKAGKATISVPTKKLKKGKHSLVASYLGSTTVTGSKAKAVTLTLT